MLGRGVMYAYKKRKITLETSNWGVDNPGDNKFLRILEENGKFKGIKNKIKGTFRKNRLYACTTFLIKLQSIPIQIPIPRILASHKILYG